MLRAVRRPRARVQGCARRLAAARSLARAAGALALGRFRSPRLVVEHKHDASPVTAADRAAEDLIRSGIREAFPDDAILGEERGLRPGRSGWRWVLDPIDGTRAFVRGIPSWATLIAVEWRERPLAGVAFFPALREELWASAGRGAFWSTDGGRPRRARVSRTGSLGAALLETLGGAAYHRAGLRRLLARFADDVAALRGWSDAYAFALVATGRADAAVDFGVSRWDVAPLVVILREAGGRMSGWDGGEAASSSHVVASNGRLHAALLARLAPFAP